MNNNILDIFSSLLDSNIDKIQDSLGEKDKKNEILSAASVALPTMLEALNKNTNSKDGAKSLADALEKDHDGTKLNDVGSLISNYQSENGTGILKHMFGDKESQVTNTISKSSGLDTSSTLKLMSMLAPLVLEYLGKTKKEQNLDADGVSGLTTMISGFLGSSNNGNIMETITNLLDSNKDGNVMDDAVNLLGKFFKK